MKIALVNPYPCSLRNSGGVEAVINSLHTELNKMDIDAEVISLSEGEASKYRNERLAMLAVLWNKLRKRTKEFDIIHAHAWSGGLLPFIKNKPKIMTAHGTTAGYLNRTWETRPFKNKWYNRLITSNLEAVGFRNTDRITAVSESTKQEIIENHNVSEEKITVVHHGVDLQRIYRLGKEETEGLRNKLDHEHMLFFMGRLMIEKGLVDLILAIAILQNDYDIQLVVAGEGAGEDFARKVADRLGLQDKVLFIGEVDNLRKMKYLSVSDAFVFPSHSEAFGMVLLEAMACKTPIVATDVSSIPEVVGDCGVLVQPANPYALAKGISKILDDRKYADKLAGKGYERLIAKFTIDRMVNNYIKIYKEAVG